MATAQNKLPRRCELTPQFWKQFFEASANVSLSGYEDLAAEESTAADESSAMRDDSAADYTPRPASAEDTARTPGGGNETTLPGEDSEMLDEGEITGSTPRQPHSKAIKTQYESPYETMRREMDAEDQTTVLFDKDDADDDDDSEALFAQRTAHLISMTPQQDLEKRLRDQKATPGHKDPLLQRVLDKNYRIQTTPHKPAYRISPRKEEPAGYEDSPMSSPEMTVPKLRSMAFMSPYKGRAGPRTPGVSVQTPRVGTAGKTRDVFADTPRDEINWESDEEEGTRDLYAGMSPPKTIQFALPPSKLLQTPGM